MWRLFRWLDRHEPGFYKFTLMIFGLGLVLGTAFLLFLAHPAAGIVFFYVAVFALLRASQVYRFEKKEAAPPQSGLPIAEADDDEVLRRVRRHTGTEKLRRHILWLAANERGKRGDRARRIVQGWKDAEARKNAEPRS